MDLVIYGLPIAAVIVGLVELAKGQGLPSRYAPVLAVCLGLLFATLGKLDDPTVGTWLQTELLGLITGLSASGLYSGTLQPLARAVRNAVGDSGA